MSGATSEGRRCGIGRNSLHCTLHIHRNTNPTPISRTPETFLSVTELHVFIGLLDHCYVLNGISLLSDANTIGTFSDDYSVADLDMFVLTTTQRVTSISPLPAPTPTKNLFQKLATTTHETDHAILGIIVCSKRGNASEGS